MAETKKKATTKTGEEKKTTTKKVASAKKTTAAKSTTTKKATTSKTTKTATGEKKTTKKVTVEIDLTKNLKPKKPTKAELKAQEAKMESAKGKLAAKTAAQKAKEAKEEAAAKAKAEKEAQAAIDELKAAAEAAKRKAKTYASSRAKVASLKLNEAKMEEEKFTKVILLHFDNKSLPKELFALPKIYEQAIFDTIMSERASRRQGTHDVKNRSEVSGGGKKPWRQKGTGRARAGSTRSPIWVGGGRAFGPTPERNYSLKVNKKVRRAAFLSALTLLANKKSVVIDDFKMSKISTKDAVNKLKSLKIENLKHILVVTTDETVYKSTANLQNVLCVKPNSVSVENLVWADVLVLSNEGLKNFEGRIK
ncbi:50S ribosomal protein L4 [Mycoplasmopsis caviae]|uniref:Large ribosomal subunit protein uL4 n=1 Tax=Mycoplasmopsis caviae TaxID=55603 RepID=A0A3P8KXE7_9BACT|nr:50S ribosomal protein L4 [Mycoplasmopsis caviae]UUD34875.1 50S ribosomal protein L4 [Mycoplasmopsis caviae]VDR42277.1 50S ribosomal protein L4 [Mycoplasmopsis caviae]